jgi:hypothetical protein
MKCPPITDEMFPPPLHLFREACEVSEAHPAAVAAQALVAFGNVVGRDTFTYVSETRHGANEFLLVVGPTAIGRKGDARALAHAPLEDVDAAWFANISGGLSSGEGLIHAVRDPVTAMRKGEEVEVDPGVPDKRLLCVESEFSGVLKHFRREANVLSNTLREAWDGKSPLRTLTKTSPTRATDAHISVIGHATPADLRAYLTDLDVANGVANRFLIVASSRLRLVPSPPRLRNDLRLRIGDQLRTAVAAARGRGYVPRTARAEALYNELYPQLSKERPGLRGALLARGPAHVTRLSLLFALLAEAEAIDTEHLTSAVAWWTYCAASVDIVFGSRTGDDAADRIQTELLPGDSMTLTEIREKLFANKIGSARLRDALDLLSQLGEVTLAVEKTAGRPALRVHRVAPGKVVAA